MRVLTRTPGACLPQISELIEQFGSAEHGSGRLNEWSSTHRPADLLEDVRSGRATFIESAQASRGGA